MTREFTGRHMATIMVLLFAAVLAANLAMVFAARQSWTGLVVKNSYVASQHFNEVTAEMEKAAAMGIRPELSYSSGIIRVAFADVAGHPAAATDVTLKLGRPSFDAQDRELAMRMAGEGMFAAETTLADGIWTGEISARIGGEDWRRPVRIVTGAK
ncbi:MAG: hypothetical protein HC869_06845 [Rhodospirillales bacterium]|nr:hypothetical protein [Rhodospirillales bacterium]